MEHDSSHRASRALVAYLLALTAVLCCLPITWLATSFVIDDALYYPRIAQNIVAGHGVTYDRRTITNGFHPLWEALLVPAAWLAGGDSWLLLRIGILLAGAFVALGVFSLCALGRCLGWTDASILVALALLYFPRVDLWLSLLESGPSMSLLLLSLYLCVRMDLLSAGTTGRQILFGMLTALIFFVRLDQVFIVMALFAGSMVQRLRAAQPIRPLARGLFVSGLTALLLVIPYLYANLRFFGDIIPVSGRKKHVTAASWTILWEAGLQPLEVAARKIGVPAALLGILLAAFATLCTFALLRLRHLGSNSPSFSRGGVVYSFALGVTARWAYLRLFVSHESTKVPWYWVPEYVLFCLVAGWSLSCAAHALRTAAGTSRLREVLAGFTAMLLALSGTLYVARDSERFRDDNSIPLENALWAREHLPRNTLCAMYDSGVFSYFSQLDTVPLNGLIADAQTMQDALDKRFNRIMERFGVQYLIVYLREEQLAAIPPGGLVHRASRSVRQGTFVDRWLCIVDRRVYSPYEH